MKRQKIEFLLHILNPIRKWKYARITRAWAEELDRGKGGIGEIVRVWHEPFNLEDANEPLWLLHPIDHRRMLEFTGADPMARYPFYLNQAIKIL